MLSLPQSMALSWVPLLLLFSFQLLVTYAWRFQEEEEWNDQKQIAMYLPPTLEFAVYTFNQQSKDWYAYKLVRRQHQHFLDSWKEKGYDKMTFSMNLQLGRTTCGKFEDDIDNCPFQESPELNDTRTCFFTIGIEPWRTPFDLWNKTCSGGHS
ncbi:putative cystatin-9-like protein CST9LP1 [Macaca nemestrina]|uniref:putative cystatin-9-like protein CST9LP1 n=1 Tax=Macaca nemestrina TaxID=9545 RepID=UPI0005F3DA2F|nr:putative cystatin-9-like protein CST9LP1 [Macaca nemestrina]